jgi:hypothetical protein
VDLTNELMNVFDNFIQFKMFEGRYIETPEFTGKAVVALGTGKL